MPVQAEAVGSVIQPLRVARSVLRLDTLAVIPGMLEDALYVPVHPVAVGSVMQALMGVRSVAAEVTEAGRLEAVEYVPVQAEAAGSVRHALTVVTSDVRLETEPSWAGMEAAALKLVQFEY